MNTLMKISGFKDTIDWYNQNAEKYAQASIGARQNIHDEEQSKEFASLLPKGARILDAGCGSGVETSLFSQSGFNVTGLDLSHGLIQQAKKRFPTCHFIEADLLNLPFQSEIFDGIWSHASLLHLEKIAEVGQVLSEFWRVLKKDGLLYILVKAQMGTEKIAIVSDTLSGHDRFFRYFTVEELSQLLKDSGFKITKIAQFNEADRNPQGRAEVDWIFSFSQKV